MLRDIMNNLKGRKLSLDENLAYEDALGILDDLEDTLKIEYEYIDFVHSIIERGKVHPKQALKKINNLFVPLKTECFDARLQVYANGSIEKHYLEFHKRIYVNIGAAKIIQSGPIQKFSTEYFKSKQKYLV